MSGNEKKIYFLALIPMLLYLISSFFIVKDYGIMIDDPEQFGVGHKNLHYYLTGHLNYQNEIPKIKNHPNFYNYIVKTRPHHVWPFTPVLSAITCSIFFQKLKILSTVPAHHIAIPILAVLFFLLFFLFLKRHWSSFIAFAAMLILMTYPRFFGHSLSNIKDLPEVLFFSLTIMYFADWFLSQKIKYLYLSFIFWGIALATKADAIFIIPILGLWLLPSLCTSLMKDSSIKLRTLMHFAIGFFITFLIIFINYPSLQPWYYKNKYEFLINAPKFIYNLARYMMGIGSDIDSTWNLYAPNQIFYTTPTLMLLFFILGFLYTLLKRNQLHTLLLIWLLLPVARHCLPKVNHYDGLRHFMVFIVPFVIIISIGIDKFAKFLTQKIIPVICSYLYPKQDLEIREHMNMDAGHSKSTLNNNSIAIIILLFVLIPNIYSLIALHPYQTTFYNKITGGLKGAQKKDIPFSSDYWLNSNLKIGRWLNKNAHQNANIHGPYLDFYINRPDLKIIDLYGPSVQEAIKQRNLNDVRHNVKIDAKETIPSNTYIAIIPRRWYRLDQKIPLINELIPEINELDIVYKIKRQGGVIAMIYHKK